MPVWHYPSPAFTGVSACEARITVEFAGIAAIPMAEGT